MKNRTAKKIFPLALAAALTVGMFAIMSTTALAAETDYENHWGASYIDDCRERGWMTGDGQGNFRPDDSITRGEFSVMLWRALGCPAPEGDCPFTDIAADAWYRNAVTALYEAGITLGYDSGLFGPNDTLTREMSFTILARAFDLTPDTDSDAFEGYDDSGSLSNWARNAAAALILKGYVEGDGNSILPKKALTRGEMAKLLVVVYDGENEPADTPPVITLTQSPTTNTYGSVTVTVTVTGDDVAYIGWRSSSGGANYTGKTGFTDITTAKKFSVSSNGWYAVCVLDMAGNFSFKLIQVTNIQTSSGGGNYTPPVPTFTVTYDANGETGGQHAVTGVSGIHTVLNDTDTGFSAVGRTFVGWNTLADGGGMFYASGAALTVTDDTTLYAMWSGDPFLVHDAETLAAIGTDAGGYAGWTLSADYKVVADISLTAAWTPIGDGSAPFMGNLDGNGHTIDGLAINDNTLEFAGLFGLIVDGSVSDLTLTNADVNVVGSGDVYAGIIAGVNDGGRISGCDVTGVVAVESAGDSPAAGGLVGVNAGGITGSHAGGDVHASNASTNGYSVALAGGLAGYAPDGSITDSSAACGVSADAYNAAYIGGIAGQNDADIFRCCFSGDLFAEATNGAVEMGGIAGDNWWDVFYDYGGVIENCYATGSMTGRALNAVCAGGIAGSSGTVSNCAALGGSISASGNFVYASRIAGGGGTLVTTNNYANKNMVLPGVVANLDGLDGADVYSSDYNNEAWWNGSGTGFWESVWGNSDSAPWQWDNDNDLPILYWQLP